MHHIGSNYTPNFSEIFELEAVHEATRRIESPTHKCRTFGKDSTTMKMLYVFWPRPAPNPAAPGMVAFKGRGLLRILRRRHRAVVMGTLLVS